MEPALTLICPACASAVAASDRFCADCGYELAGTPPAEATEAAASVGDAAVFEPDDDAAFAEPDSRVAAFSARRDVRALRFELGIALCDQGRAAEARGMLQSAASEPGEQPPEAVILLSLAWAAKQSGRQELIVPHLLEASRVDADAGAALRSVRQALALLSPAVVQASGRWILQHWWPAWARRAPAGPARGDGARLAAMAAIALGEHEAAGPLLMRAADEDAAQTQALLAQWLAGDRAPPAIAGNDAEAALRRAQLWRAAGDLRAAKAEAQLAIDRAADLPNYADAPGYALLGKLQARTGAIAAAAYSLYEAGKRHLWRREPVAAVHALERARSLDPSLRGAAWSLADARYNASFERIDAAARLEHVRRGLEVWDQAVAGGAPTRRDAWAHATRASLIDRQAELRSDPDIEKALWEAAVHIERAIALDPTVADRHAHAATLQRRIGHVGTAIVLARRAVELAPKRSPPLTELVTLLCNTGQWEEAEQRLAALREVEPSVWVNFAASRMHLYQGRIEPAMLAVEEALRADPADQESRQTRLVLLRRLHRDQESRDAAAEYLSQHRDKVTVENRGYLAAAALEVGELEFAERLAREDFELARLAVPVALARRTLAQVLVAQGRNAEALEQWTASLDDTLDRETKVLARLDVEDLRRQMLARGNGGESIATVDRMLAQLADAPLGTFAPSAPDELRAVLAEAGDEQPMPWSAVAVHAMLARLALDQGDATVALAHGEALAGCPERFPEAGIGIALALDRLHDESLKAVDAGDAGARARIDSLLATARRHGQPAERLREQQALRGLLAWRDGDAEPAFADWAAVLGECADPRWLATTLAPRIADTATLWALHGAWAGRAASPHGSALAHAAAALSERLAVLCRFGPTDASASFPSLAAAIAVEVDSSLVPAGEPADWLVLKTLLPGLRETVRCDTGVVLPGVRLRENGSHALGEGRYLVLLHEVQVASGREDLGRASLDDAHRAMVTRLETLLRGRLHELLGVDDTRSLLAHWQEAARSAASGPGDEEVSRAADPVPADDPAALWRAHRLLRALLRDQVPLTRTEVLLRCLREGAALDDAALLIDARRRLRELLPGNRPGDRRIELPDEVERRYGNWLSPRSDGPPVLEVDSSGAQFFLAAVGEAVAAEASAQLALVVADSVARPHLLTLVGIEFPSLALIARDELALVEAGADTSLPTGAAEPVGVSSEGMAQ